MYACKNLQLWPQLHNVLALQWKFSVQINGWIPSKALITKISKMASNFETLY